MVIGDRECAQNTEPKFGAAAVLKRNGSLRDDPYRDVSADEVIVSNLCEIRKYTNGQLAAIL